MLRELHIENIGIIERQEIQFNAGLNVLTGETGAGKSIIIMSFSLLLGQRVKPQEIIKTGKETARITGMIEIPEDSSAFHYLIENNISLSSGELLILREIQQNGKNRCLINGQMVTLNMLKDLGDRLVDIHGTHDHQILLNPLSHQKCLDRFGNHHRELSEVDAAFQLFSEKNAEISRLLDLQKNKEKNMEYLRFQLEELSYLEKVSGEEADIEREHLLLSDSGKLSQTCSEALTLAQEDKDSILSRLKGFKQCIRDLSEADSEFRDLMSELESAVITIGDICSRVENLQGRLKSDPARLEELDVLLGKLKKHTLKYGTGLSGLKELYARLKDEIQETENPQDLDSLQKEAGRLKKDLEEKAMKLSVKRKKTAAKLEKSFQSELHDLGMPYAKVVIQIDRKDIHADGEDKIEFMLASNPGETAKPLSKIASGGELCRIMLAFKVILASVDDVPILVFDEIDANIGGVTSVAAAQKMRAIAESRQVITITHQPQIAAKAQMHFSVSKKQTKDYTQTFVRVLGPEERVEEIARMLGGSEITSVVKEHARQMIEKNGN